MKSVNKVIAIGNIGNEPELRYMPSGDAVSNISLACSDSYKDKNGVKQDRTEWMKCVAFGRLAENITKYLKKGSKIYIEGRLQTRSYDKDGVKMYSTEIILSELVMLDSRAESASKGPRAPSEDRDAGRGADIPAQTGGDFLDDEIPFARFMDGEL